MSCYHKVNLMSKEKLIMNSQLRSSSPLSHFIRASYSSIHKNTNINPKSFDRSMIESSHSEKNDINSNSPNQKNLIKKKLLFANINNSIDKVKKNIVLTKQRFETNRRELNNVSNYLLNKINELNPQNNNSDFETKRSVIDQSKEIIDSMHRPLTYRKPKTNMSEFYEKNKHHNLVKSSSSSNLCAKNTQSPKKNKSNSNNNTNIPQSCQKIERMKKYIFRLFNDSGLKRNLFDNQDDTNNDNKENNKLDIFQPSYRRKITNQIYDLKKFQIFIDYNSRKENPENLKEFAKNNLQIIKSIKDKCQDIADEKKANELDADIDVDDLIHNDNDNDNDNKKSNDV